MISEYKITMQKPVIILYSKNVHADTKTKNAIPFTWSHKYDSLKSNKTCIKFA